MKSRASKKKLGEILMDKSLIDQDQLNAALAHQRLWGYRLGTSLIAKGFIGESTLVQVLGEVLDLNTLDLSRVKPQAAALRLIPVQTCENHELIPITIRIEGNKRILTVAMSDPMNLPVLDEIEFITGCRVKTVIASISAISAAIRRYYRGEKIHIPAMDTTHHQKHQTGRASHEELGSDPASEPVSDSRQTSVPEEKTLRRTRQQIEEIKARRAERLSREQGRQDQDVSDAEPSASDLEGIEKHLPPAHPTELDQLDKLENYFWALMRVMAKKGLINKDEFLRELKEERSNR